MEYQLLIFPDLDLSPQEIVTAWNADGQARATAAAHLSPSPVRSLAIAGTFFHAQA